MWGVGLRCDSKCEAREHRGHSDSTDVGAATQWSFSHKYEAIICLCREINRLSSSSTGGPHKASDLCLKNTNGQCT